MTNKELEAKVINAQSAVAKREAVLAKHREQLAKLIAKGADQYDIRYKEDDIKTATGKLEDARRILKNWQDKLGSDQQGRLHRGEHPTSDQRLPREVEGQRDHLLPAAPDRFHRVPEGAPPERA